MGATPKPLVLWAEDSEDDTLLLKRAAKGCHSPFVLSSFPNGQALINHLQSLINAGDQTQLPALVVTDLSMPLVNGFEVIQWIRSQEAFKELPVAVLSASPLKSDIDLAQQLGANHFKTKMAGEYRDMVQAIASWLPNQTECRG